MLGGGTWSVLLGCQKKDFCVEIIETIVLVIDWWALPLQSLHLIGLLNFSFKILKWIVQIFCHSKFYWTNKLYMHWLALFSERNKYNQKISKIKYEKSKTETIISIVVIIIIAVITTFLLHFMTDTLSSLYVNIYLSIYLSYLSICRFIDLQDSSRNWKF